MSAFGSPPPVLIDSRPAPMSDAERERLARMYTPGSLIKFNATTRKVLEPFKVSARVVEEPTGADYVTAQICNEQNDFCKVADVHNWISLPKKNIVCLTRTLIADETCGVEAAGGAKKKSRRHKPRKPSKTKRKTRRAKKTRKRRA